MPEHEEASAVPTNSFVKAIHAVSRTCGVISALMIFSSVLITCQMIWVRFVLNQSTIWQTETVVYLMIGATLIGLPYVQYLRGHVNVDLLPMLLPPTLRRWLSVFTFALTIAVTSVITFYGYEYWHMAFERGWKSDSVWGVPLWIPYMAIPLGFGLFVLQLLSDLCGVIAGTELPFAPAVHGDND